MTPDWSPSTTEQSRRSFMRATVATLTGAATASLAGCSSEVAPQNEQPQWPVGDRLDYVPERATTASYMHVQTVLEDEGVSVLLDYVYGGNQSGQPTVAGIKSDFEEESGLELDDLREAVAFGNQSLVSGTYVGYLLFTDWEESEIVESLEESDDRSFSREQYAGRPIYVPETEEEHSLRQWYIGVVDDGTYVTGTEDLVRDTLDVAAGNTAAANEQLRSTIQSVRPGPVQFAYDIPQEQFDGERQQSSGPLSPSMLQDVSYVYGSLYRDEEIRGAEITLDTADEQTARDFEDGFDAILSQATEEEEPVPTIVANTETRRDGSTVTLVYEATVDELEELVAKIEEQQATESESGTAETPRRPPLRVVSATGTATGDGVGGIDLELQLNGEAERFSFVDARGIIVNREAQTEYPLIHAKNNEEVAEADHEYARFVTEPTDVLDDSSEIVTLKLNPGKDTAGYDVAPFGEPISGGTELMLILESPEGYVEATLIVPEELGRQSVDLQVEQERLEE